ncbi:MAG: histidine phosphatase family protein [Chloroflexi bacterium]|nr:histidine phosphatase family protein [Chloroflexota bacterium]
MATGLYLIRHGESFANVQPIIGGMQGDVGLTPRGHRQAALLEQRLAARGPRSHVLYTSTLPRAVQTSAYVARALGLPVQLDEDWQELRPGEADGLSVAEWKRRYDPSDRIGQDPFQPFAPGGDSWATFLVRIGSALNRVVERHPDQTVVVVCHGGVLSASMFHAAGLGPRALNLLFDVRNTSITHWRYFPARDAAVDWPGSASLSRWSLVTFNDTAHLEADHLDVDTHEAVPTPVVE